MPAVLKHNRMSVARIGPGLFQMQWLNNKDVVCSLCFFHFFEEFLSLMIWASDSTRPTPILIHKTPNHLTNNPKGFPSRDSHHQKWACSARLKNMHPNCSGLCDIWFARTSLLKHLCSEFLVADLWQTHVSYHYSLVGSLAPWVVAAVPLLLQCCRDHHHYHSCFYHDGHLERVAFEEAKKSNVVILIWSSSFRQIRLRNDGNQ